MRVKSNVVYSVLRECSVYKENGADSKGTPQKYRQIWQPYIFMHIYEKWVFIKYSDNDHDTLLEESLFTDKFCRS